MKFSARKFVMLILTVAIATFALCASSCEKNTNNNKTPPQVANTKVLAPYVVSLSTYLSWDSVSGATAYDIYRNNSFVESLTSTTYQLGEVQTDTEYYVIAKNDEMQSEKSNVVTASKNANFTTDEILDLSNVNMYSSTIESTVRKVVLTRETVTSFSLTSEIAERTTDLVVELKNVNIKGGLCTKDKEYSRLKHNYNVILDIEGECTFVGTRAYDGYDFSESLYNDQEIDADRGQNGGDVFVVPSLILNGSGNLAITGGKGGNGGRGSSTSTWSDKVPGKGADGGNGGAGVKTSYFILAMDSASSTITITEGEGGAKGRPGGNNSIVTGPLVTAMWNDIYDIGKSGSKGQSVFGTRKNISGKLILG